jgi:hypothetical protein
MARALPAWARDLLAGALGPRSLAVLAGVSALLFVASMLALPWLVARMPADYFSRSSPSFRARVSRNPVLYLLRNLFGLLLLLAGIAMLFLPGQGLLTIFAAVVCMDFPGKRRLERRFVSVPAVVRALNALRRRAGEPPLVL